MDMLAAPSRALWGITLVLAAVILGCGGANSGPRVQLQGQVTVDETPIPQGTISFTPTQGEAIVAPIQAGKYVADVPVGSVRVMFQATRETGRQIKMYDVLQPEVVNMIPVPYQAGVELTVTEGQSQHDFLLKSR